MSQIFSSIGLLIIGFFILICGANYFVEGASALARRLRIPQIVIGLTLVAMGTSLPEAAVSIMASLQNKPEIAFGNVIGSNIFNLFFILGVSALMAPLAVKKNTYRFEIPLLVVITFAIVPLSLDGKLTRKEAGFFLVVFLFYLLYLVITAIRTDEVGVMQDENASDDVIYSDNKVSRRNSYKAASDVAKQAFFIIGGLLGVFWGSELAVANATTLAMLSGMSERLIGLTIVSVGTSLPELFTSVTATIKGNSDIAIGNIVGSNIFNILFILGISAEIRTIAVSRTFIVDSMISYTGSLILLAAVLLSRERMIGKRLGAVLLAGYAGYFVYLLMV